MNSTEVVIWEAALANQFNNLRKDVIYNVWVEASASWTWATTYTHWLWIIPSIILFDFSNNTTYDWSWFWTPSSQWCVSSWTKQATALYHYGYSATWAVSNVTWNTFDITWSANQSWDCKFRWIAKP